MNGATRLNAISKSGLPQPMLLIYFVPKESFATMDTGKVRTCANVLETHGIKYESAKQAAISKSLIDMSQGCNSAASTAGGGKDNDITNERILRYVLNNKSLLEKATKKAVEAYNEHNYIRANILGAWYLAFCEVSQKKADEFMEG